MVRRQAEGQTGCSRRHMLRRWAFGAASVLVLPLLAACGGSNQATTAGSATSGAAAQSATPARTAAAVTTQATSAPVATSTGASSATTTTASRAAASVASSNAASSTSVSARAAGKETLLIWHNWGKTGGGLAMSEQAKAFGDAHPDVTIELTDNAGGDKMLAAIASGTPPDAMVLVEGQADDFVAKKALQPLDSYFARDHIDMAAFWPIMKEVVSVDGKLYGMPHHQGCYVFFWNKTLFREAGLDPDKPPTSWGDITALTPRLTKMQGSDFAQLAFIPTWVQATWSLVSMIADGVPTLAKDGKTVAFDNTAGVNALSFGPDVFSHLQGGYTGWSAWFKKKQSTLPAGPAPQSIFVAGQLATLWWGNWLFDGIQRLAPNMEVGVAGIPSGPDLPGKSISEEGGGAFLSIPTGAKNAAGGWSFLAFVGSPDGQYLVQKDTSDVAALMSAAEDPRIVKTKLGRAEVLPLFKAAVAGPYVRSPVADAIGDDLTAMQNAVLERKQSPRDALHNAAMAINGRLATTSG